jgi:hypothetical protein
MNVFIFLLESWSAILFSMVGRGKSRQSMQQASAKGQQKPILNF